MSARKTGFTVASAACLALSCTAVQKYEGYAPTVVPDRLANGLPTGGFGETEGVKLGETHDRKFWSDRLAKRLAEEYDAGIGKCITADLPDGVRAIAISGSYNAGVDGMCKSPMVALWNAGDIRGGCEAFLTSRKGPNGEVIYTGWRIGSHPHGPRGPFVIQRGLINRRADEKRRCVAAINPAPDAPQPPALPVHDAEPAPAPIAAASKPAAKPGFWCWLFKCSVKS